METSIADIAEWANSLTVIALLVFIVWSGFKKKWVFGWVYDESKKELMGQLAVARREANDWRELAMKGTDFAEKLAENGKPE